VAGKENTKLTRFELEIMQALWSLGKGSVREIQEHLPARKRTAYTTIQTIVRRLEEKNAIRRVRKIGNAFIFEPTISRSVTHNRLVGELLDLFGGSAKPLMAHLVETGRLSLADIQEIENTYLGQEGIASDASDSAE